MSWAVAWATPNPLIDVVLGNHTKFRHLVIGTHLYQTHPKVLAQLCAVQAARVIPPDGKLFHPKVYLFHHGDRVSVLVGSHNLTSHAMSKNIEASILLEGSSTADPLAQVMRFMEQTKKYSREIPEFLYGYEALWNQKKEAREALSSYEPPAKPEVSAEVPPPDGLTWNQFLNETRTRHPKAFEQRLQLLEKTRNLFENHANFAAIESPAERKLIAGTMGKKTRIVNGVDTGVFGQMSGNGEFAKIVIQKPERLSLALDKVPGSGGVTREDYSAYVKLFRKAFAGSSRGGGVPTATRLLAMKRPDYFVCLDGKNKKSICAQLGIARSHVNLDTYWDMIIEPLMLTPWWTSAEPVDDQERRVWSGRMAMLDAIYFVPKDKKRAATL